MTAEIIQDDVLHALQDFELRGEKFDAVVMDPPYCSGGLLPAQVARGAISKYNLIQEHGGQAVFTCPAPLTCTRIHPTQKPEKVYAHLYNILEDGARVLELFSGSASGGVAAIHNGFDYVGVESSPFYVASSRKRLRDELARKDFLEPKPNKKESKKEETPLFLSVENDDSDLVTR